MINETMKDGVQVGLDKNCSDEEFLTRVFSHVDDGEEEYSLLEVPRHLNKSLHDIAKKGGVRRTGLRKFLTISSVAASILFAFMIFSPSLKQSAQELEVLQAKQDLELVFSYLQKANGKASSSIHSTVSRGLTKSTIKPVITTIYDIKSS